MGSLERPSVEMPRTLTSPMALLADFSTTAAPAASAKADGSTTSARVIDSEGVVAAVASPSTLTSPMALLAGFAPPKPPPGARPTSAITDTTGPSTGTAAESRSATHFDAADVSALLTLHERAK